MSDREAHLGGGGAVGPSMPCSDDAEKGVLSCFLQSRGALSAEVLQMPEEWFYNAVHRGVFFGMRELVRAGQPIEMVLVSQRLRDHPRYEERVMFADDGKMAAFMAELECFIPIPASFVYYRDILRTKHWYRTMAVVGAKVQNLAISGQHDEDPLKCLTECQGLLFDLTQMGAGIRKWRSVAEVMTDVQHDFEEVLKHKGHIPPSRVCTGFTDLDRRLMGLQPQDFFIIAARPAMGKSALAMNIAECVSLASGHYDEFRQLPLPVGVVTLEMPDKSLLRRAVMGRANVNLRNVQMGFVNREEIKAVSDSMTELAKANLHFLDVANLAVEDLMGMLRVKVPQTGMRVLVVDYLQLLTSSSKRAGQSRQIELGVVAMGLKQIAKTFNLVVIALAQVGRGAEDRPGCVPTLADLRESGDIEAAADIVGFIVRDGYYEKLKARKKAGGKDGAEDAEPDEIMDDRAKLYLAKFRDGSSEPIEMIWEGPRTRFGSMTHRLFSNREEDREGGYHSRPQRSKEESDGQIDEIF